MGGPSKKQKLTPPVAKAVRSQIKRELRKAIEAKKLDTLVDQTIDWTGTVIDLTSIDHRVAEGQRIGDTVTPSSLDIRWQLTHGDNENALRVLLIQWHQDTQVFLPGVSSVLEGLTLNATTAPFAHYNKNNRTDFRVIKDFTLKTGISASTRTQIGRINLTKAVRPVNFNGQLTSGTDKIYLMLVSDSGAATHPGVIFNCRLNYRDA